MKQIEVVAAIIHDDEGRIFATQRGYGDYKAAGKRGQSDACISYAERRQTRTKVQVCEGLEAVIASGPIPFIMPKP